MDQTDDLLAESLALRESARVFEKGAETAASRAAEWDEQITDYNRRSVARIERDWNLQLADTLRRKARSLRKKADRLYAKHTKQQRRKKDV